MKNIFFTLCIGLCSTLCVACSDRTSGTKSYNEGINVIPQPQTLVQHQGRFALKNGLVIGAATPETKQVAQYFADKMAQASGYAIFVKDRGDISLVLDQSVGGRR